MAVFFLVAGFPGCPAAHAALWTGGGGNLLWNDPDNWTPVGVPGANDVVYVKQEILLNVSASTGALVLDPGTGSSIGGITPFGGADLTLNAGILNNNGGIFRLNDSDIVLNPNGLGESFINGTGQIFMQDSALNNVRSVNGIIYHATGHTIVGSGKLLSGQCGMVNRGIIQADATVMTNGVGQLVMINPLVIDPGGTNNTFVNLGTVQAIGAAGLAFASGNFVNTTNTLEVFSGSKLVLRSGAVVQGGTLRTLTSSPAPAFAGGKAGIISAASGPMGFIEVSDNSILDSVTLEGHVVQGNYVWPQIRGGLTNNGVWFINGTGSSTDLRYDGSQGLWGTGRIEMSDANNNRIFALTPGDVLTNGAGHTITGAGNLLYDRGGLVNYGTIRADAVTNSITIDPNSQGFYNRGTLQAAGPAGLVFAPGRFDNVGNTIEVLDGSKLIMQNGATLFGGVLDTAGSGYAAPGDYTVLDSVTLDGHVVQGNYVWPQIRGGLTNNGIWFINGTGSSTELKYDGSQGLWGTGRFEMSDANNNRIFALTPGDVLTNGPGHTITGAGNLLYDRGGLVNYGTIRADAVTNGITIDPDSQGFYNRGTLQAAGPAGLVFAPGRFDNAGNTIEVLDGSKLTMQSDATLFGGVLNTAGSGYAAPGDYTVLDSVTLEGHVVQGNYVWPQIRGGLTNNGVWFINGTGSSTELKYDGSQGLWGTGRFEMSDFVNNRIFALTPGDVLTNGPGHTITGAGNLLYNRGGLVNYGTIRADAVTNSITIDPDTAGFYNRGTLQAAGNPGVAIASGPFVNFSNVLVEGSSQLNRTEDFVQSAGLTRVDGTLTASGLFRLLGGTLGGTGSVSSVSNSVGVVSPGASAGILHIAGDYGQGAAGTLHMEIGGLAPGTESDQLVVSGTANLDGSLQVSLVNGFVPANGQDFVLLSAAGGVSGGFNPALTFLPHTSGLDFQIVYTPSNVVLKVRTGQSFASWQAVHFPEDLGHPEISGQGADPDGDGMPNLFEFGADTDPNVRASAPEMRLTMDAAHLVVTFSPLKTSTGVDIQAVASRQLIPWLAEPTLLDAVPIRTDLGGAMESVQFRSAQPTGSVPEMFVRLQAVLLP